MKAVSLLLVLALFGCATPGKPNRLLPWNWFKPDPVATVQKFEAQLEATQLELLKLSQRLFLAAQREMELDPAPSMSLRRAIEYHRRGSTVLAEAIGPLGPKESTETTTMVEKRKSEDPREKAEGDKALAVLDRQAEKLQAAQARQKARIAEAIEKEHAAYARAREAEEKYDRMWFYIYMGVGAFVFIQLLPLLATVFPALALPAKAANAVLAPVATASLAKMKRATGAVIALAEKGTVTAAAIREHFDPPLAEADQNDVRRHYLESLAKSSSPTA